MKCPHCGKELIFTMSKDRQHYTSDQVAYLCKLSSKTYKTSTIHLITRLVNLKPVQALHIVHTLAKKDYSDTDITLGLGEFFGKHFDKTHSYAYAMSIIQSMYNKRVAENKSLLTIPKEI